MRIDGIPTAAVKPWSVDAAPGRTRRAENTAADAAGTTASADSPPAAAQADALLASRAGRPPIADAADPPAPRDLARLQKLVSRVYSDLTRLGALPADTDPAPEAVDARV